MIEDFSSIHGGTIADIAAHRRMVANDEGLLVNDSIRWPMIALGLVLFGCGGGATSYTAGDIDNQTPQGLVDGESWTMQTAIVVDDGTDLSVSLYPIAVEACDRSASSDTEIIFSAPRTVGEYPLNFSLGGSDNRTITFVTGPGENVIATQGLLVVEAISATEVTMALVADAGNNSINGRFTVPVCPDAF